MVVFFDLILRTIETVLYSLALLLIAVTCALFTFGFVVCLFGIFAYGIAWMSLFYLSIVATLIFLTPMLYREAKVDGADMIRCIRETWL